jgi:predicted RNA methylase
MRVSEDVLKVLDRAKVQGSSLFLQGQLDRNLYTATNKVLEAAGGKWSRGKKAHVFDGDAAERIEQIILTGDIVIPQDFGFYPTPEPVVARLSELAQVENGMRLLEPSAGIGNIAKAFAGIAHIDAIELLPKNCAILRELGFAKTVLEADFLSVTPNPVYDRAVMNPPFEKQADIKHILHAHKFLKPGGLLVSVMASSVLFRDNKLTTDFREFVEDRGGSIEPLPDGAFKQSGTMVNTVIAVIPN